MAHAGAIFDTVPRGPHAVRDDNGPPQAVENIWEKWRTGQVFNLERGVRFPYGLPSLWFPNGPKPLKSFGLQAPAFIAQFPASH